MSTIGGLATSDYRLAIGAGESGDAARRVAGTPSVSRGPPRAP